MRSGETNGDAGDQYIGLDRFGQVVDQRWVVASSGTATDRFGYTYDRDSNRTARTNTLNTSFNESYGYDDLNQLTSFARGSHTLAWDLDATGNFESVTTDGGSPESRTHNRQNEVTQVGSNSLAFDANGNLTTDETGKTLVYDAWNRLVAYKNGGTTLVSYQYDGLGRRVVENPGTARDLYYSAGWQVVEERVGGSAQVSYVWSPVYVDALICRDRDTDANGSLDERLYVQQDANWNVTALVNTSGTVLERYAYDPYGARTVYDASWTVRSGGSNYGWVYGFQGRPFDATSGTYNFRNRDVSPSLGRPVQADRLRFAAGDVNFFRWEGNGPVSVVDPSGLWAPGESKPWGGRPVFKWEAVHGVKGPFTATIGDIHFKFSLDADLNGYDPMQNELEKLSPDAKGTTRKFMGISYIATDLRANQPCGNGNKGERVWMVFANRSVHVDGLTQAEVKSVLEKRGELLNQWFRDDYRNSSGKPLGRTTEPHWDQPGHEVPSDFGAVMQYWLTQVVGIVCRCKANPNIYLKDILSVLVWWMEWASDGAETARVEFDLQGQGLHSNVDTDILNNSAWVNLLGIEGARVVDRFD